MIMLKDANTKLFHSMPKHIYHLEPWEIDDLPDHLREAYEQGGDHWSPPFSPRRDKNYIIPYEETDERIYYWIKGYWQAGEDY